MKLNANFDNLVDSYLFAEVENRVSAYKRLNPDKNIIKLGIGDVTLPLCSAVVEAGKRAVEEMGVKQTFRGYGPYRGYTFLTQKIADSYRERGIEISEDEVFVSDGAKSDVGNILDLFSEDCTVLVPDPVYPVYVDTNVMQGRKIIYADACEENGFLPLPDKKRKADIIYICSPNNPTGAAYNRIQLKQWVDYALECKAVILFDAAYEFFVSDPKLPRSIFEIEGAKECAIEFCSLSKTAGFTGTRCGYAIVPHALGKPNKMWLRRQSTKFNGVSYVVQRMAEAVFTATGREQISANIGVYKKNAAIISATLGKMGIYHTGGVNSPYIWLKCGGNSWDFFDKLLAEANVVGTPGAGFGRNGEGFFRLTAFNDEENTAEAMRRFEKVFA
ncbi:LL-diaminopimelate aminotransferase [Pumilibacter intestinalis]|uniref:LL-diaminopimelate aminotransferase n=1 Tax=Pumilibacter intestinalis TaxID=2941511 RepID=UPI00203E6BCA|nr:LL-diaminopimelate aminotransferase [Pumilibacter intestinalis]